AIPLLVFHLTGSALSTGITYALEILPFALVGLVGGSLADRTDRRRLMIACDFTRFAIMATFSIEYARGALTLPTLYAGIVVISAAAAVFMGGQASSIPYLVGKARSSRAVAALVAAEQTSNFITPPIGGAIFAAAGALPALIANASTYLLSQVSLIAVPTLGPDAPGAWPGLGEILRDIRSGFRFLVADAAMLSVTLASFGLNLFGLMGFSITIPYLKTVFGASDALVGVVYGGIAVGSVIGALIAGRFGPHLHFGKALCIAYLVDAVIYLPVLFAHHVVTVLVFFALSSAAGSFQTTQIIGWRIRIVPEGMVGSVFGAVRLVALIGMVPGSIAGGYLAQLYGPRMAIIVSGVGFLLVALYVVFSKAVRAEQR
ncbi:MAG TPA: MFS transporter, partial [Candidatus Eremiobacteraceae bacterium]|nr:MFS transporter [Candidatus Eremiobacteraceae bacterium]